MSDSFERLINCYRVNDCILSANGVALESADYAEAIRIMKESQQLNMVNHFFHYLTNENYFNCKVRKILKAIHRLF